MTIEHRKECVSIDLKVSGVNQELAQWIIDHEYTNTEIAEWLGCDETRIRRLRKWANGGFVDRPNSQDARSKREAAAARKSASPPNFEDDNPEREVGLDEEAEVETPELVLRNLLIDLDRHAAAAHAYGKIFKVSSFDAGMKKQISEAIDKLIGKWRLTQATLARKERSE